MITAEMIGYAAATVDARWAAQTAALEAAGPGTGAWWGSDADYFGPGTRSAVTPSHRHRRHRGRDAARLPASARHREAPPAARHRPGGRAVPGGRPGRGSVSAVPADERMLSRIRALLAKAESTEFAEEAEALSGRAQELMAKYSIDHALLAAEAVRRRHGRAADRRRQPLPAPEATLRDRRAGQPLRVVWSRELGLVTMIGFPADLDAVELLFTSLLVPANTAMLRTGGGGRRGPVGDRGVRQLFLSPRGPDRRAAVRAADRAERSTVLSSGRWEAPRPAERGSRRRRKGATWSVPRGPPPAVDGAVDEVLDTTLTRTRRSATDATAGTPAAPPPTWPACITRPRSSA